MARELLLVLERFGGGSDPGDNAVRFLLAAVFWVALALVSSQQYRRYSEKRDLYIALAAGVGFSGEMVMFFLEYGSYRGYFPVIVSYRIFPPLEHALIDIGRVLLGFAYLRYFLPGKHVGRNFLMVGIAVFSLLYLVTAPLWIRFLDTNPGMFLGGTPKFGMFWGDMAYRVAGSVTMGAVLVQLMFRKGGGKAIPSALYIGFLFLFLDEFLMLINLSLGDNAWRGVFRPIRHNLGIWAIPLFLATYWSELVRQARREKERLAEALAERRKMEDGIRQVQKLESLGLLAGGIAHDFNNLLVSMLGNADLALRKLAPGSPVRPYVQRIDDAAQRAADLTNQLLAYSGRGKFVVARVNLSAVVEEMASLLDTVISKRAALSFRLDPGISAIEADPSQIRQVVMNLMINASDAIGNGDGDITVTTGMADSQRAYIEVSDTGCGMDEETKSRIFDPFFTTKDAGRGLGLSAVIGIVRGHGGEIRVSSEPDRGTTFKLLFPAACPDAAHPEASSPDADVERQDSCRRYGIVLVVDDEEAVRGVAKSILEDSGFTVLTATDGAEAVEVFRRNAARIDVVLLDVTMPRMGGEEAFRELRRIDPNARVILSTGYSEHDTVNRFVSAGLAGFIQKPYRVETLVDTVNAAMPIPGLDDF